MFTYIKNAFGRRFDHPIMAAMYVISAFFAVFGALFRFVTKPMFGLPPSDVTIGFFGVYAVFFASIGTIAYGLLYLARLISEMRDRMGPAAG